MQKQTQAYLYTALAILFWSTVATAFKLSLRYLTPLLLLFFASLTATLALFLILIVQGKLHLLTQTRPRDYLRSAGLGIINPLAYYLILFRAYELLPAQIAQPVNCTWAVLLVLFSIPLLKQKIGWPSIGAICISFMGVFVVTTRGNLSLFKLADSYGVCLALISSVFWALYWIFNIRDKREEVSKLFLNFLFGSVYITLVVLATGALSEVDLRGLPGGIYVGLFEMGLTFFVWLKALQLSENTAQVSNYIYLFPFLSLIFIRLLVGEIVLPSSVIGLFFIVGGILLQNYIQRKKFSRRPR